MRISPERDSVSAYLGSICILPRAPIATWGTRTRGTAVVPPILPILDYRYREGRYREGISKVQILDYRGVQRGYREGISKVQILDYRGGTNISKVQILDYRRGTRKVQRRYKYRHWRGQVK